MSLLGVVGRWLGAGPDVSRSLREAIERAVDTVDPLLRTVSGYERRLAGVVEHALAYGQELAGKVPGPVAVDRGAFAADGTVNALFAAPDAIGEMLGRSRALRDFLGEPGNMGCDRLFALLGVRRREKAVSGMAANGGVIRRDVPQRLLYFADHTLGELACSEAESRQLLQAATLDSLARGFAACVAELRQHHLDARTALQVERARNGRSERRQELETRQREAVASLAPQRLLDAYADWLATPHTHIYLRPNRVCVDRMGVIAEDDAGDAHAVLELPELIGRDRRHWTLLLVAIRREHALEAIRRHDEANRYLLI